MPSHAKQQQTSLLPPCSVKPLLHCPYDENEEMSTWYDPVVTSASLEWSHARGDVSKIQLASITVMDLQATNSGWYRKQTPSRSTTPVMDLGELEEIQDKCDASLSDLLLINSILF
jgi:hypothetical protein